VSVRRLVLLIAFAAGCVSAELHYSKPELAEVGYDLAAKAAAFYAEKYFPGSSVGPGEPVYDITDENTVVGWYFIADTNGEDTILFREYIELDEQLYEEYLMPLLINQPFDDLNALTKYGSQIEHYHAIYISNYFEHCPILNLEDGMQIAITGTPYDKKEICSRFNALQLSIKGLYSLLNSKVYAIQFEDNTGNQYYSIHLLNPVYYSANEMDELIDIISRMNIYNSPVLPTETWQDVVDGY
jgi:hypothetical protein